MFTSAFPSPPFFFFFFCFVCPYAWHMEVPRLGVKSKLELLATATATAHPSHICELYHSSWQCQIPEPLSEARDQTHILMDTSQIHFCCPTRGTPPLIYLFIYLFIYFPRCTAWGSSYSYMYTFFFPTLCSVAI